MSIISGTLAKEVDGKVDYIYPKTTADLVELNNNESVEDKITKIDGNIKEVNKRIDNIATGIKYGSINTKNDAELIDIRIQNFNVVPNNVTYSTAGESIRGQFQALLNMINDIKKDLEDIKKMI